MTDGTDALKENSPTTGAPVRGGSPTGEDPFVAGAPEETGGAEPTDLDGRERDASGMAKADPTGEDGPSYERAQPGENQVLHDDRTGGSSDSHDTLGHADSGDETVDR